MAPEVVTRRGVTADELLTIPDDGMRHELRGGELTTVVPPGFRHGASSPRSPRGSSHT